MDNTRKIYLLTWDFNNGEHHKSVLGAFSTKEKAIEYFKKELAEYKESFDEFELEEIPESGLTIYVRTDETEMFGRERSIYEIQEMEVR